MMTSTSDDVLLDETCGCYVGCLKKSKKRIPFKFLQFFATPQSALILLSFSAFLQGFIVNGLINASITTLETRFELTSAEAGLIASCYDIASCIALLFVTFVGGRGNKPLWLGWGIVVMGLGSIVFSLPHFIAPPHQVSGPQTLCSFDNATDEFRCSDSNLRNNRFAFYVGQLMTGFGATPLYTLGVTYLDENVEQVKSSLYHGIYYSLSIVGPGIGFLLAGYFLTIYTILGTNPGISPSDPNFIGAWWLPFLIFGIVTFFFGFLILLFPHQLPNTEEVRKNRQKEIYKDSMANDVKHDDTFGKRFRDFPKCILLLLRNVTFVFLALGAATDGVISTGVSTFGPKIIESLFKFGPSQSALAVGAIAIVAGAGGQFVGGLIVFKSELSVRGILKLCVIISLLALAFFFIFLFRCPDVLFAGANTAYPGSDLIVGAINSTCNNNCGCSFETYDPVCGSNGVTYYSACFAGCSDIINGTMQNCSCISLSNQTSLSTATSGLCADQECANGGAITFLAFMFLAIFLIFSIAIPGLQATIRIVLFTQRSFAVGVQWLMLRVLGTIPGPLLFGFVLDKACIISGTSCGQAGSCSVYSNDLISKNLSLLILLVKGVGVAFYVAAYVFYKKPPNSSPTTLNEQNADDQIIIDENADGVRSSEFGITEISTANGDSKVNEFTYDNQTYSDNNKY